MGEQFALIFDIMVIVVVIVCVYIGSKRGFLRSLILLVGNIAAILLALWLSGGISSWIYDNWIEAEVVSGINEKLDDITGEYTFEGVTDSILSVLPDPLADMLTEYIQLDEKTYENINESLDSGKSEIATTVANSVVKPMVVFLIRVLVFVLLVTLAMIAVKLIAGMCSFVNKIPIVGTLNSLLGGALGLLEAGIVLMLITIGIRAVTMLSSNELIVLNEQTIEETKIYHSIYEYDIFEWIQ